MNLGERQQTKERFKSTLYLMQHIKNGQVLHTYSLKNRFQKVAFAAMP